MNVACTYGHSDANARLNRVELSALASQSDAALERFTDIRAVIDQLAPGITPNDLTTALRLYTTVTSSVQTILNSGTSNNAANSLQDILDDVDVVVEQGSAEGQRVVGGGRGVLDNDEEGSGGKQGGSDESSRDHMEEN
jgi:hypothetical protein